MGLRERKKDATRQALHEAALRLVREQGFDRLTVEAIADAAMVSRRTFSNYFSSKEEALAHGDLVRLKTLLELFREAPADLPVWSALASAAERLAVESDDLTPQWLAQRRALHNYPTFVAYQLAAYAAIERDLAAEIAERLPAGPDAPLRSRVLAATYLTTLRVATRLWIDQPDRPLPTMIHEALSYAPHP